ncbi:metal ABC transporter solute-binding protein, Zn/Mn family [Microbacterium pumilum]|uniref:Zinc ABC transporter substrate-binding protein n=1 Tax=Microbacterium pumilum TaxID=344165 RepID=A0ABP5DB79_9MICO
MTLAAASALALAGCAGTAAGGDGGPVAVVASTSAYGQIAEAIGGDLVDVTPIISSAAQDPHSFEPSARDQLAVRHADLVIENGGGYDAFVDALIEASGSKSPVLTAVEFSWDWPGGAATESADGHDDHDQDHGHIDGFNEHVWYDVQAMGALAQGIQSQLEVLDPGHAAEFATNLDAFMAGIAELEDRLARIDEAHGGTEIFVTEPLPLHLTDAAGLVDVAPDDFTQAVEEGQDVAPATLLEALKLLRSDDVAIVIVNAQTGGTETTLVLGEADAQSVPVLEFAETLPAGDSYIEWMQANIAALTDGLAQ